MNGRLVAAPREWQREDWISIALAVAMHVGLVVLLVYGIRWQTEAPAAVEVELFRSVPLPPVETVPEPTPQPRPEPKPEVQPPKPPPPPPPVVKPDIAIKKVPEKIPPKPEVKPPPKPEPKPQVKPENKPEPRVDALDRLMKRDEQQMRDRRVAAQAESDLAQMKAGQAAAARNKGLARYTDKISAAIRSKLNVPPDVKGNPEAEFEVAQLPSGEVLSVKLRKSSGNKALDDAIERAIMRASPLPKPDDPSLFQRDLALKFRPLDE